LYGDTLTGHGPIFENNVYIPIDSIIIFLMVLAKKPT